jgi:peptidyl-dipeptidase Dcp
MRGVAALWLCCGLLALAGAASAQPAASHNPLLVESSLPFNYPPFDRIRNEHFLPAFEQGMSERLAEVQAIAGSADAPTFDNTIVALERAGALLRRARIFFNLNGANGNPDMQKVARTLAPKLAAHNDAIQLDPALFRRIDTLYAARDTLGLDPESARLLWRYHRDFVRAGVQLPDEGKARLRALNAELATLQTTFEQNVLKERDASAVIFATRDELAGLDEASITEAAAAAKSGGMEGKFLIALGNTTGQASLTVLKSHVAREKLMAASLARGSHGGPYDNRAVVAAIARKRADRALLLGYPNHAAFQLEDGTAGTVELLNKTLAQLAPPAVANARREAAAMQGLVDEEKGGYTLGAADWAYFAEKKRVARYDLDDAQLRPYYELDHVLLDGVFYAAGRLYGLRFNERRDLPVYEPSVRVFDVLNEDGSQLAIFLFDAYARPNKDGGAWASAYVGQSGLLGTRPVVANHLNIPKPPPGQPTLLTHDEVTTAFHEFGHALHAMFSRVIYPRSAGVPLDFVEYPSQVNEMWANWPEVLEHYARHYQTGAALPRELLDKVHAASRFNVGFTTTEYLAATLLDQAWHQVGAAALPDGDGVLDFEAAALKRYGVDLATVPPRYRSTYFSHTFSGGYSAGYYAYIWAEVLDADTVEWMKRHGGLKRENGDSFRNMLLSRGGSIDALQMFRDFTGGEPDIQPLLVRRGLDAQGAAASQPSR